MCALLSLIDLYGYSSSTRRIPKNYLYMLCCDIFQTTGGEDDDNFTAKIVFSDEVTLNLCYITQL
jgi:hypothetical protein